MGRKRKFQVVTAGTLKKEHVPRTKAHTVALDTARIPSSLHELIPYAEKWGVSDDTIREELLTSTPPRQLRDVLDKVTELAAPLSEWLGGIEARSSMPSKEYVAFSALRMFADDLRSLLDDC
jgi:hypothetical protein